MRKRRTFPFFRQSCCEICIFFRVFRAFFVRKARAVIPPPTRPQRIARDARRKKRAKTPRAQAPENRKKINLYVFKNFRQNLVAFSKGALSPRSHKKQNFASKKRTFREDHRHRARKKSHRRTHKKIVDKPRKVAVSTKQNAPCFTPPKPPQKAIVVHAKSRRYTHAKAIPTHVRSRHFTPAKASIIRTKPPRMRAKARHHTRQMSASNACRTVARPPVKPPGRTSRHNKTHPPNRPVKKDPHSRSRHRFLCTQSVQ